MDADAAPLCSDVPGSKEALASLLQQPIQNVGDSVSQPAVGVGHLVALEDGGSTAWVTFENLAGGVAVRALTSIDLDGRHVGRSVLVLYANGDSSRPIVTGVIRSGDCLANEAPEHVSVEADGARLVVSAKERLVLRCGQASITLTRAGKILIEGTYVSSRSSGANKIRGGSIQLN
jgi:hypothetical protein